MDDPMQIVSWLNMGTVVMSVFAAAVIFEKKFYTEALAIAIASYVTAWAAQEAGLNTLNMQSMFFVAAVVCAWPLSKLLFLDYQKRVFKRSIKDNQKKD